MIIPYNASKEERDRITAEREKKLYQSFENMRKQIDDQIQTMNFSTVSERVKRQQLEEIRHELQKQLQGHYNALEAGLKNDMVEVGGAVLKESEAFYSALQMPIGMSITSFPVEIMNNVVNGSVYQEKWYLSKALWGDYTEKLDQINEVISNGIGLNLPSFEIAKQLEQYVDPSAMTPSKTIVTHCLQDPVTGKLYSMDYVKRHPEKDWTGFKEKDSKFRYGKVDYNAQRLARTLINHAYQQNVVHQAQANPFATGVRWDASGGERMCEICEERDGKIFPADDVPLDHPNGMCTFEVVTDLNMMEMSNVLVDFVKGEPTAYDDKLYDWYNDRAVKPEQKPVKKEEKKERKTKAKTETAKAAGEVKPKTKFDKDVNKWYNTQSDFKGLMQKIQSEFGSTQIDSVLAYYNKYVLGIGAKGNDIVATSGKKSDGFLSNIFGSSKWRKDDLAKKLRASFGSDVADRFFEYRFSSYTERGKEFILSNLDAVKSFGVSARNVSFFRQGENGLFMTAKAWRNHQTFAHEFGHAVDYKYGIISSNDTFGRNFYSLIQKEGKALLKSGDVLSYGTLKSISRFEGYQGVTDALSAFASKVDYGKLDTRNIDIDIAAMWSHSKDYWNRKQESDRWKEVTSETFANMCAAAATGEDGAFKEYFPEAYAYFKKEVGWDA